MRDYTEFVRMAKESKNLDELKAKVLESGSGAYFSNSGELMTGVKDYYAFFKKKKKREKERNSLKYPLCVDCGTLGCLGTQFGNHKLRDCFYFAELTKCQRFQYLFNRHTHKHIHTQC